MPYTYDPQNIFAKILRGEIPNKTVLETGYSLAFHDIAPQAPCHVLVVPRGAYVNADHFATEASDAEIVDFTKAVAEVSRAAGVAPGLGGDGYRLISNAGEAAIQEVPHYHVHVIGGRPLGPILRRSDD
ncbi:MAG: HIT domain-containing protein [Pseudomonadota bacterium]